MALSIIVERLLDGNATNVTESNTTQLMNETTSAPSTDPSASFPNNTWGDDSGNWTGFGPPPTDASEGGGGDGGIEFVAFIIWYIFLVLCCIIPTCCAYKRRRRFEARMQAQQQNAARLQQSNMFVLNALQSQQRRDIEEGQSLVVVQARTRMFRNQLDKTTMVRGLAFQ